jgi:hypothetical protein
MTRPNQPSRNSVKHSRHHRNIATVTQVLKMTVEQVVNSAGDGHLRDENDASEELRGYLRICPSGSLFTYAKHCLENTFDKSGLVL